MTAKILPFDPQEAISEYLKKHPQTRELDQKIIDKVAEFFDRQTFADVAIDTLVQLKLTNIKMEPKEKFAIRIRLTAALIDCAERKPISLAKL